MKAIQITDAFGIQNLNLCDVPDENLAPTDIKVKMLATSLNYRDLMMIDGRYNPKQPLPLIPCSDGVAEVVEVGAAVDRFKVGDRVCALMNPLWLGGRPTHRAIRQTRGGPLPGMLSEYNVSSQEAWVLAPRHLTDHEASTLTCAGVTAWSALVTQGRIKAGQTVVVQGTGGVSLFALLIAKMHGANVIITSSSDEKLEIAKSLGADHFINYQTDPEWHKKVREITEKRSADHIIEVGGAKTLEKSLKCVAVDGQIHVIGILSGLKTEINLISLLMQNVRMQGVFVGHRESFEDLVCAMQRHDVHPYIDEVFHWHDAQSAFKKLESAKHVGKIVLSHT